LNLMRVLYLTNNPIMGGTVRPLQYWLRSGPAVGLEGRVLYQRAGDFSRWLESSPVPTRHDPMTWPGRWWPFPSLWRAQASARWARGHGVDLIHCNEHDVYPFGLLLRRFLNKPLVCSVQFQVNRAFCQWAFGGARRPDALIWTADSQRRDCAAAIEGLVPPDRQYVIPLGLDPDEFGVRGEGRGALRRSWGVGPDDVVIGTASALRPRKRIEDFVEVVRRVADGNPRVVAALAGEALAGDEAYGGRIHDRIRATGLGRRFLCLGQLEPIEPFMHGIDLFVSTSEYETFGMSVCESMACRRPVAAYAGGSVREVVGDTGAVVETGDLDGLTAAVRELVADPGRLKELGERARQRVVNKFHSQVTLRQLMGVYRDALARA
jgi:glycosyltransferase involved in cell wall biosynthesis